MRHLTLIVFVAALLILAIGGTFASFFQDDYCYAADAYEYGVLGSMGHSYWNWSPRYTYMLINAPMYLLFNERAPLVTTMLCIVLMVVSWYWVLRDYVKQPLFITLGFVLGLLWTLSPLTETLYWMPAAITYILPLALIPVLWKLCMRR